MAPLPKPAAEGKSCLVLVDQAALIELHDAILFNGDGPYISGSYLELWADIHIANATGADPLGPLRANSRKYSTGSGIF